MKGTCKPRRKSRSGSAGLQSPNLINIIFSYLKKTYFSTHADRNRQGKETEIRPGPTHHERDL